LIQTDVGFDLIATYGPTNRLNVAAGNGKPLADRQPNLNQGAYEGLPLIRDNREREDFVSPYRAGPAKSRLGDRLRYVVAKATVLSI
jgi:hypothetical protein